MVNWRARYEDKVFTGQQINSCIIDEAIYIDFGKLKKYFQGIVCNCFCVPKELIIGTPRGICNERT